MNSDSETSCSIAAANRRAIEEGLTEDRLNDISRATCLYFGPVSNVTTHHCTDICVEVPTDEAHQWCIGVGYADEPSAMWCFCDTGKNRLDDEPRRTSVLPAISIILSLKTDRPIWYVSTDDRALIVATNADDFLIELCAKCNGFNNWYKSIYI